MIAGDNGRPASLAAWAVTRVWAPTMGAQVASERAAQVACCYDPTDPPTEDEIRGVVRNARLPIYGAVSLTDEDVEGLTHGALAALRSLGLPHPQRPPAPGSCTDAGPRTDTLPAPPRAESSSTSPGTTSRQGLAAHGWEDGDREERFVVDPRIEAAATASGESAVQGAAAETEDRAVAHGLQSGPGDRPGGGTTCG